MRSSSGSVSVWMLKPLTTLAGGIAIPRAIQQENCVCLRLNVARLFQVRHRGNGGLPKTLCLWAEETNGLARHIIKHLGKQNRRGNWANQEAASAHPRAAEYVGDREAERGNVAERCFAAAGASQHQAHRARRNAPVRNLIRAFSQPLFRALLLRCLSPTFQERRLSLKFLQKMYYLLLLCV
jgi:hypothetical protein